MINLIPPSAKKGVVKEYWKRVITVWLFILGTSFLILSVFLLPTYVRLQSEIAALQASVGTSKEHIATYDVSNTELTSVSKKAEYVLGSKQSVNFSEQITNIESKATNKITLQDFDFTNIGGQVSLKISGMASTRQDLVNFKEALEKDVIFDSVVLPIENLIKSQDILFVMDLKLSTTTVI